MKTCPYCEAEIVNNAKKCKHCGETVVEEKEVRLCPYCESELSDTAKKCKFCGNWIYEKRDIVDNQSDEEQNVANLENVNSNKELIMAIIGGILLIIACIKLGYILWGVILLVAGIFLTMPYYIERVSKK